jgi:hypothetical protein
MFASVTLTVTATVVVYTDVRCPACNRLVMTVPGRPVLEVRVHRTNQDRLGRGAVVGCGRCKGLVEVIHRDAAA